MTIRVLASVIQRYDRRSGPLYDVFISYSRKDASAALRFEKELRRQRPGIRIFLDRKELRVGIAWQIEIFESLDQCHYVAAFLSPSYVTSKICKEEFNIAWVRGREADQEILFPLYVLSAPLPTYMKTRQYLDCREADPTAIRRRRRLCCPLSMNRRDDMHRSSRRSSKAVFNPKKGREEWRWAVPCGII